MDTLQPDYALLLKEKMTQPASFKHKVEFISSKKHHWSVKFNGFVATASLGLV